MSALGPPGQEAPHLGTAGGRGGVARHAGGGRADLAALHTGVRGDVESPEYSPSFWGQHLLPVVPHGLSGDAPQDSPPDTITDLRSGPVMKPDLSNGFLRLVHYPFRTEQELLEKLEADMRRYPTLAEGWDGYGAEPLIPESLDDGRKFLAHRPKGVKVPFAELSPTGEFGLYWEEGRAFAQIVFEGNGKFYYLACCRPPVGEDIWHQGEDCDADSRWPAGLLDVVREVERAAQRQDG